MDDNEEVSDLRTSFGDETAEQRKQAIMSDLMQIKGVGKSQAEKLYNAQIYSCLQIAGMPIPQLMDKTGFNKKAS